MAREPILRLAIKAKAAQRTVMTRKFLAALALFLAFAMPSLAKAEPADIDAAARGVVRVVIMGSNDAGIFPVSHGSGFAVTPTRVVTNAHVVRDAVRDTSLRIGIVPSEGEDAVFGKIIAVSPRNDLALVEITGNLRLPPLALAGGPVRDSGESYSVGYPMNVDRAQGLEISDIFKAQPPVKSRGFLAGARPSKQFHTVLHTAPIARGNSGGPLLDGCGRVLGVNSFGADSGGADAEFFFAVSNRELIPFLRENGVEPRSIASPCRSLAELEEEEEERLEDEQSAARAALESQTTEQRELRERAQFEAEMHVRDERDDRLFGSVLALLLGAGMVWWGFEKRPFMEDDDGDEVLGWNPLNKALIALGIGAGLLAMFLQFTRPGIDEIDRRVAIALSGGDEEGSGEEGAVAENTASKTYLCTIQPERSRITSSDTEELEFVWNPSGCVNERTQYGYAGGTWSRVFVPNQTQAVSVASFDPARSEYRTERYLLNKSAMDKARGARSEYSAPSCGADDAAASLGDLQGSVLATLPTRPNERLVYSCEEQAE
jgi:hypothetical protein